MLKRSTHSSSQSHPALTHVGENPHARSFLAWKRVPHIGKQEASLLGRSGLSPKILRLPLYMLIMIGDFLYNQAPNRPLEWLILSALFKAYASLVTTKDHSVTLTIEDDKEITQALFTTLFMRYSSTHPAPLVKKVLVNESALLIHVQQKTQEMLSASFHNLTLSLSEANQAELALVISFGTEGQKNLTVHSLLHILFLKFNSCSFHYQKQSNDAPRIYKESYEKVVLYLAFIERLFPRWDKRLISSLEQRGETRSQENKMEYEIIEGFKGCLFNAKRVLESCPPPHPSEKGCIIS